MKSVDIFHLQCPLNWGQVKGHIGLDALSRIVQHPKLRELPFILETPNDLDGYAREIQMMREVS